MRTRRLTLVSLAAAALGCQHPEAGGFAPATLEIVSGNDQVRAAGKAVREPLVVRVLDEEGRPVPGAAITFRGTRQAVVSPAVVISDDQGHATLSSWTLRRDGGPDTLVAVTAQGDSVRFTALALRFVDIDVSGNTACGLLNDHSAVCWGQNFGGAFGTGDTLPRSSPIRVGGELRFDAFSIGSAACGVTRDHDVYCAGYITYGPPAREFIPIAAGMKFQSIVSDGSLCALGDDQKGYCWGVGVNSLVDSQYVRNPISPVPLPASSAPPLRQVTVAWQSAGYPEPEITSCTLDGEGRARCYDLYQYTRLRWFPDTARYERISNGGLYGCGLVSGGTVRCWGSVGYLGFGGFEPVDVPVPRAVDLEVGYLRACAATVQAVYCWGSGQTLAPVPGSELLGLNRVSVNWQHACGLDASGQAWCWGDNSVGQLGDGSTQSSAAPVRVQLDL